MNNKYTQISLSYKLAGEHFSRRGVYSTAKLSDKATEPYKTIDGEVMIKPVIVPSVELQKPEMTTARCNITLNEAFIINSLERPQKPKKRSTQSEYNIWYNWPKMSQEAKLAYAVNKYVEDMGGNDAEFELL